MKKKNINRLSFLKIFNSNLALAFKFSLKSFLFLATCFYEKLNIFSFSLAAIK